MHQRVDISPTREELEQIAAAALKQTTANRRGQFSLPVKAIVRARSGRAMKVRVYPTAQWAADQQTLLSAIEEEVRLPRSLGRIGQVLFFEHLDLEEDAEAGWVDISREIGTFLARLWRTGAVDSGSEDLDREFASWLIEFADRGLISPSMSDQIWSKYQELRPDEPATGLDYWDAMPHNFGLGEDELVLLDEKHLRGSYIGVGLVKPSFFLDGESFAAMLAGFSEYASKNPYADHRRFLELYYAGAALHYYVEKIREGGRLVRANPRLRFYRGLLMRRTTESRADRIRESFRFSLRHPLDSLIFLATKMIHPTTWRKLLEMARLRRLDWGLDEP